MRQRGAIMPAFLGSYQHIHWGFVDPAGCSADLNEERAAFQQCFAEIKTRIETLVVKLPIGSSKQAIIDSMQTLIDDTWLIRPKQFAKRI